ncbi:NAD(P)-dependent oxidoreductase [Oscillibacter valericigenes]|nr:NAD(P)-dependent oxidoreductase [Oscillibacter valericigenes]
MKVIVFGGNGFVGQWLVRELKRQNYEVLNIDQGEKSFDTEIAYCQVDIRDKNQLEKVPFAPDDIVVNLVANQYHLKVPRKNREAFFRDTNTVGAENILITAMAKDCMRVVQFTTDMTYGKPQYLPLDTSHPQNPFGPYGRSKKEVEDICRDYREKGMKITIFRPRMINGPGRLGILKKLFWLIQRNLPVPTIGAGKNCYQMVSVFDCVSAIICAIKKDIPNEEFNLGSKNPPSTRQLLQGLVKRVGSHSPVIPTPGKLVKLTLGVLASIGPEIMYKEQYMIADEDYILDITKTERELSWEPQYNDQDMIVEAYEEYKKSLT